MKGILRFITYNSAIVNGFVSPVCRKFLLADSYHEVKALVIKKSSQESCSMALSLKKT